MHGPINFKFISAHTPTHTQCLMRIVNSRTRHFVVRQQCKENQLLHFHDIAEPFYIVDRHIYANIKNRERIVVFPWQKWLRECATR
jgi:hypothetical protein